MKVIDLLNKIANGEEVPKKIKYDNQVFEYRKDMLDYYCYDYDLNLMGYQKILDDEVEIIEEDKPVIAKEELENRIENALEFLETQYNTFPSGEMWREALKNTLQGKDYDDVYVEDKKIDKLSIAYLDDMDIFIKQDIETLEKKINEIIDYINKGDK